MIAITGNFQATTWDSLLGMSPPDCSCEPAECLFLFLYRNPVRSTWQTYGNLIHWVQFNRFLRRRCSSYVNSLFCVRAVSVYECACRLNLVPDSKTMPTGALMPPVVLF